MRDPLRNGIKRKEPEILQWRKLVDGVGVKGSIKRKGKMNRRTSVRNCTFLGCTSNTHQVYPHSCSQPRLYKAIIRVPSNIIVKI